MKNYLVPRERFKSSSLIFFLEGDQFVKILLPTLKLLDLISLKNVCLELNGCLK